MINRLIQVLMLPVLLSSSAIAAAQAGIPEWKLQSDHVFGSRGLSSGSLSPVNALTIDRDRNVIVSQPDSGRIKVFRSDGTLLAQFGKKGTGPDEFGLITSLARIGDTVVVLDQSAGKTRAHLYDSRFHLIKTVGLAVASFRPADPPAMAAALMKNGRILSVEQMDPVTRKTAYGFTDLTGHDPRVVLSAPASRAMVALPAAHLSVPIGELSMYDDEPLVRADPDGSRLVVVDRASATDEHHAAFHITVFRVDGSILWSREYPYVPALLSSLPVDRAIKSAALTNAQALGGAVEAERAIRAAIGPLPKFQTPIAALLVGTDGTIWLAKPSQSATTTWVVLDQTGTPVGRIQLPSTLVFAGAQRGWVWSVVAEGREWFVEQYRIIAR